MPRHHDPPAPTVQPPIFARRRRVLLVDGDAETRTMVAQALVDDGLTVDEAVDANDALTIVDYAPPDVVVYSLGWGAGLRALDRLEEAVIEHGDPAPAVVLRTPAWVRAERGITVRGRVAVHELVAVIERAVRQR